MTTTLPLAISMGDASGIGPEIVAKARAGSDPQSVHDVRHHEVAAEYDGM